MTEALADAIHHRGLERVVMQDRGIDEGADLGFAADNVLGLGPDLGPDRIDLLDRARRPRLFLRHSSSLRGKPRQRGALLAQLWMRLASRKFRHGLMTERQRLNRRFAGRKGTSRWRWQTGRCGRRRPC